MTTLARVVFLALVAATFGAFFVAQRLKGSPPVVQLHGQRWLSPNGDGRKDRAELTLRVRESDMLTADLIDAAGNPVRRLVTERPIRPSRPVRVRWDGRTDDGTIAPDGVYRVRGSLLEQGRSVVNPKLITLDTTPPRPRVREHQARARSWARVPPEMSIRVSAGSRRRSATRFRVIRTDAGAPQLVAKGSRAPGLRRWHWDGRVGRQAGPVRGLRRAGAGARPRRQRRLQPGAGAVRRRRLARARPASPCARWPPSRRCARSPRARGRTSSSTRARAPTAGRSGAWAASGPCAAARWPRARRARCGCAPRAARVGLYLVELQAGRNRTEVPFLVQARERATMLVVVPAITWLGTDPVDDPPLRDGMPDTLDRAGRRPRALAARVRRRGRPPGGLRLGRGARALPGPQQDPLRPHERPRPRPVGRPARERPQGRPAGRAACAG